MTEARVDFVAVDVLQGSNTSLASPTQLAMDQSEEVSETQENKVLTRARSWGRLDTQPISMGALRSLPVLDHALALAIVVQKERVGERHDIGGRSDRTNLATVESIYDILHRRSAAAARANANSSGS